LVLRRLNKQVIPYVHPTRAGKEVKRMAAKVYKTGFHLKYDSWEFTRITQSSCDWALDAVMVLLTSKCSLIISLGILNICVCIPMIFRLEASFRKFSKTIPEKQFTPTSLNLAEFYKQLGSQGAEQWLLLRRTILIQKQNVLLPLCAVSATKPYVVDSCFEVMSDWKRVLPLKRHANMKLRLMRRHLALHQSTCSIKHVNGKKNRETVLFESMYVTWTVSLWNQIWMVADRYSFHSRCPKNKSLRRNSFIKGCFRLSTSHMVWSRYGLIT